MGISVTTSDRSQTKELPLAAARPTVSVVIACYDMGRMNLLQRAIHSVNTQDYPNELTVVVDHNEELYVRLLGSLPETVSSSGTLGREVPLEPETRPLLHQIVLSWRLWMTMLVRKQGGFDRSYVLWIGPAWWA